MIRVSLQAQFQIPGRLPCSQTGEFVDGNLCIPLISNGRSGGVWQQTMQSTSTATKECILVDVTTGAQSQVLITNLDPVATNQNRAHASHVPGARYPADVSMLEGCAYNYLGGGYLQSQINCETIYFGAMMLPDTLSSASAGAWTGWTYSPSLTDAQVRYQRNGPLSAGPLAVFPYVYWGACAGAWIPTFSPDGRCTFAASYCSASASNPTEGGTAGAWYGTPQGFFEMPAGFLTGGLWVDESGRLAPLVMCGNVNQKIRGYTYPSYPDFRSYEPAALINTGLVVPLVQNQDAQNGAVNGIDSPYFLNGDQILQYSMAGSNDPGGTIASALASYQIPKCGRDCIVVGNWDVHNNVPVSYNVARSLHEAAWFQNNHNSNNNGVGGWLDQPLALTARCDYLGTDLHGRAHHAALISRTTTYFTFGAGAWYKSYSFLSPVVDPVNLQSFSAAWFSKIATADSEFLIDIVGNTPDGQASFTTQIPQTPNYFTLPSGTFCAIEFLHIRRSDGLIGAIVVDTLGRSWYAVGALPLITGGYTVNNFRRGVR